VWAWIGRHGRAIKLGSVAAAFMLFAGGLLIGMNSASGSGAGSSPPGLGTAPAAVVKQPSNHYLVGTVFESALTPGRFILRGRGGRFYVISYDDSTRVRVGGRSVSPRVLVRGTRVIVLGEPRDGRLHADIVTVTGRAPQRQVPTNPNLNATPAPRSTPAPTPVPATTPRPTPRVVSAPPIISQPPPALQKQQTVPPVAESAAQGRPREEVVNLGSRTAAETPTPASTSEPLRRLVETIAQTHDVVVTSTPAPHIREFRETSTPASPRSTPQPAPHPTVHPTARPEVRPVTRVDREPPHLEP
jgi:hypothetical protein